MKKIWETPRLIILKRYRPGSESAENVLAACKNATRLVLPYHAATWCTKGMSYPYNVPQPECSNGCAQAATS
jgi:hypothetical protein